MTRSARTCGPDDSLTCAAGVMWDNDCGCVPVVDADGKAIAMITDRDICMAGYTQGKPLWQIPVSSAASHGIATVRAEDTIEFAENTMRRHRVRRVPVVDASGRPIGVLSLNDLARHTGKRRGDLDVDGFVKTTTAICEPTAHPAAAE